MLSTPTSSDRQVAFCDEGLEVCVSVSGDGTARLVRLVAKTGDDASAASPVPPRGKPLPGLPLIDVVTADSGRAWSGGRYVESATGGRLRYAGGEQHARGPWQDLTFRLEDPESGLRARVEYSVLRGGGVLRARSRLENAASRPLTVESVTSFMASGLAGPGGALNDLDVFWAESDWLGENRWHRARLSRRLGRSEPGRT